MSRPAKKRTVKLPKSKKFSSNPVVAYGLKIIPKHYRPKVKKFVDSHSRIVPLTMEGIVGLYGLYLFSRSESRKTFQRQNAQSRELKAKMADMTPKLEKVNHLVAAKSVDFGVMANLSSDDALSQSQKLSVVEKGLADKGFKEFLDKKHNLKDVRMIKRGNQK